MSGTYYEDLYNAVIFGAKWQQEPEQFFNDDKVKTLEKAIEYLLKKQKQDKNKYSEEEVLEQLNILISLPSSTLDKFTDKNGSITMKWFEQFKKK